MKKIAIVLLVALLVCALPTLALAEADKPFAGTEIKVYNWYDYIDPDVLGIFQEETGIKVNYVNFSQNEDMYTRLSTGAEVYDVIFPSDYMVERLITEGNAYDEVIAIGPVIMMKFVCQVTKKYGVKTVVSMNPIMIDGTGMCGGCRLTVGGETKFACVDGPDFDGHLVDFDEAMKRGAIYRDFEQHRREEMCNLLNKEVD